MNGRFGSFISYARNDGEKFAAEIHDRLQAEEPELQVWMDRTNMQGGRNWWKQITDAIESREYLVLVMTPAALASETVRREWLHARKHGVCVCPVMPTPLTRDQIDSVPRWMSKSHFYNYVKEWETFKNRLKAPCTANRVPFMAPPMPERYVHRPTQHDQLRSHLLDKTTGNPVAITTTLHGAGGFGKTALATALCHDDEVIDAFDDGILWLTLGQEPNILSELTAAYAALTGERVNFESERDSALHLRDHLSGLDCLVVIDDVWQRHHLGQIKQAIADCACLITTRFPTIVEDSALVPVDEMESQQAVDLLASRLEERPTNERQLRLLAGRMGEWPLLLRLAAAALKKRMDRGDTLDGALKYLNAALDRYSVTAFDRKDSSQRQDAVENTVGINLELLPESERALYVELGIFPEDEEIPFDVLSAFWGMDSFDTEELLTRFDDLALLDRLDLGGRNIRLHDVMRSYLLQSIENSAALHGKLLDSWPDAYSLPHGYAWKWFSYHMAEAGRKDRLREMLLDLNWLSAKLHATNAMDLVRDFDILPGDPVMTLLASTIRFVSHVLNRDPEQLPEQVYGRLMSRTEPELKALVDQAAHAKKVWLRPLFPTLREAGGAEIQTIAASDDSVESVAVTPDSKYIISGSWDDTVKLWRLDTGELIRTFEGHESGVTSVAVTPDGRRIVSGSWDKTVKIWDLSDGTLLNNLTGHTESVNALAVSPDGTLIVSGSSDCTLKVWSAGNGELLHTLVGHSSGVTSVVITPDGEQVISGSEDKTARVWDMKSGELAGELAEHTERVKAVAVSPDGSHLLTGSSDLNLMMWNLRDFHLARTFDNALFVGNCAAITPDGGRAFCPSTCEIEIIDLESGQMVGKLEGHSATVTSIAFAPARNLAISGSRDGAIKVWDMKRHVAIKPAVFSLNLVSSFALTHDGLHAVSATYGGSIDIWDMVKYEVVHSLGTASGLVQAMAVSLNNRYAVTGSHSGLISVWSLVDRRLVLTVTVSDSSVTSIAMTADCRRIVCTADDQRTRVFGFNESEITAICEGPVPGVDSVLTLPDGRHALSCTESEGFAVWDLETGDVRLLLEQRAGFYTRTALSPNGLLAVAGNWDGNICVWSLESGRLLSVIEGHTGPVNYVVITSDCSHLISTSDDRTLRLWNLVDGSAVAEFDTDEALDVCGVTFDRRTAVVRNSSGRLHFFRIEGL